MNILLADDHEVNQKIVVDIAESFGHSVTVVEDGNAALTCLQRQSFDLILMDYQMPMMDGNQAASAVRVMEKDNENESRTVIIAMSAGEFKQLEEQFEAGVVDGFLPKPFQTKELIDLFRRFGPGQERKTTHTELPKQGDESKGSTWWFSQEEVLSRYEDYPDMIERAFQSFIQNYPRFVEEIQGAIHAENRYDLLRAAHNVKTSIGYLTTQGPYDTAKKLEVLADNDRFEDWETSRVLCRELEEQLTLLHTGFEGLVSEMNPQRV
ncbi:MAG: response regulator [Vampirovibrio sp.]|nr:response regulator [Vampirovibrio sp.]